MYILICPPIVYLCAISPKDKEGETDHLSQQPESLAPSPQPGRPLNHTPQAQPQRARERQTTPSLFPKCHSNLGTHSSRDPIGPK